MVWGSQVGVGSKVVTGESDGPWGVRLAWGSQVGVGKSGLCGEVWLACGIQVDIVIITHAWNQLLGSHSKDFSRGSPVFLR